MGHPQAALRRDDHPLAREDMPLARPLAGRVDGQVATLRRRLNEIFTETGRAQERQDNSG